MRRSQRLPLITKTLLDRPGELISLTELAKRFGAAKSTISEDVAIIRDAFAAQQVGRIETVAGAAGGVRYIPHLSDEAIVETVTELCEALSDPQRILPGGFLYMSDLVSAPTLMSRVGELFADRFHSEGPVDAVVTLETRGIPIALMTARSLNAPLAIVRRASRVTEGTVVTMNYVSGSARRIETMSLSRRALPGGARVLIIDDFMKAGGTARGLVDLMEEFGAKVVGMGVLIATAEPSQKLVKEYTSLAVLERVDEERREVVVRPSSWVERLRGNG